MCIRHCQMTSARGSSTLFTFESNYFDSFQSVSFWVFNVYVLFVKYILWSGILNQYWFFKKYSLYFMHKVGRSWSCDEIRMASGCLKDWNHHCRALLQPQPTVPRETLDATFLYHPPWSQWKQRTVTPDCGNSIIMHQDDWNSLLPTQRSLISTTEQSLHGN